MSTSSKEKEEKIGDEIAVGVVDRYALDIFSIRDRVMLDPKEVRREFGDDVVDALKLTKDGKYILWPQPSDSPEDPQNWSDRKKNFQLFIIILASIVSDFDVGIGIPAVFELAKQYNTTPGEINDMVQNWSIFLIGWGGLFFVPLVRRYGRLGTLFWTQLLGLGFLVGATFAPTLGIFTAMRCLTAFFSTCPQITGLYTIIDLFPFHLQARKINLWAMGIVLAPHLSPFLFGFLVAHASWRWAFGVGCIYSLVVLVLIILFMEESMYNREASTKSTTGSKRKLIYRLQSLVGIVGFQSAKEDATWKEVLFAPFILVWRPHLFLILVFELAAFGFGIGINITNSVFLESPPPFGFGFTPTIVSAIYGTPVVAVFFGLLLGHYLNDWVMDQEVKRNKGAFRAEARLWTCYIGVLLYVVGFVILGAALQNHFNKAAIIIGWGIAQTAVLVITVPVYAYCNDCFPGQQGEISSLLNLCRTIGGFSVAFYQVSWAEKNGALQTLGCEAAIVVGCFFLIIPFLQIRGRYLRSRFTPKQKPVPASISAANE